MKMNTELIEHLRIESGIARLTAEWDQAIICVNREGNVIDPLEGLALFAKLIVEECIDVVEKEFWSDPHEVYKALELIKNHFGNVDAP